MSRARSADTAQAHRLRWFLSAHLLAVFGIFEVSIWVAQHLATPSDPVPSPQVQRPAPTTAPAITQEPT